MKYLITVIGRFLFVYPEEELYVSNEVTAYYSKKSALDFEKISGRSYTSDTANGAVRL